VQIRAFVRWEEAGKPENMPPEWQQREYALALLDLQRELAEGVTLNTIRKRYGQSPVEGDDEPLPFPQVVSDEEEAGAQAFIHYDQEPEGDVQDDEPSPPAPQAVFTEGQVQRRSWDMKRLINGAVSGATSTEAETAPISETMMARWSRRARKRKGELVSRRLYKLGHDGVEDGQLLVELWKYEKDDPTATSGPRKRVLRREVEITSDVADPLVLHWGVAKDEPNQWLLPPENVRPPGTEAVSHMSCETDLVQSEGCLRVDDEINDEVCYPIQTLTLTLPGEGSNELMGIQYVIRTAEGNIWYKDSAHNGANFISSFSVPHTQDELTERIIRSEASGSWWSLMHRYNLCRSLLDGVTQDKPKNRVKAMAKLFVWLRYSATRHLTWQRNYNVKPRELSSAQQALTLALAEAYVSQPALRELIRLTLGTLGRGGDGGEGQQIRDEILNIMHRNNIKEVKGIWMEEWHQKLHNNTTPDDVIICEAYLAFLRGKADTAAYWRVLGEGGITRERLESFERPIKAEPLPRPGQEAQLIKEFENYGRILRKVHSGADLVVCMEACGQRLPAHIKSLLSFIISRQSDNNVIALIGACVEARQELVDAGLAGGKDPAWVRELLYLDLAIDDVVRRAVERAGSLELDVSAQMQLVGLVLENLCLSNISSNEELVTCAYEWRRTCAIKDSDPEWALHAKATVDRLRTALSLTGDTYSGLMQPTAEHIGRACGIDNWVVDVFAEEVIRGGPAFALSLLISRLDPLLRQAADMGSWQVISPQSAAGYVKVVQRLDDWQSFTFEKPTVLVVDYVSGAEEMPAGATAVLTGSTVDVLSHASVRARNLQVTFATCYDSATLDDLRSLEDCPVTLNCNGGGDVLYTATETLEELKRGGPSAVVGGPTLQLKAPKFCGQFAVPMNGFVSGVVGAKSQNTAALFQRLESGGLPDWVGLPASIALPFGTFEAVLDDPINKEVKKELKKRVKAIDLASPESTRITLRACRHAARKVVWPIALRKKLLAEMTAADMEGVPSDEDRWGAAWDAIKEVWASMWTERAYISLRNVGCNHADLRMSVLCQRIIPADYAFVIHTVNPSTGCEDEIYAEVVRGLGETLVGNYPGRALSFVCRKDALSEPVVQGYPSKSLGLFVDGTFIFRSDSNGEDLEGYAGAGLFESVPMDKTTERVLDYSEDPLVWDADFRHNLLSKIASVGAAVEKTLGCPQDIEGVVRDGQVYVVQTRPQV